MASPIEPTATPSFFAQPRAWLFRNVVQRPAQAILPTRLVTGVSTAYNSVQASTRTAFSRVQEAVGRAPTEPLKRAAETLIRFQPLLNRFLDSLLRLSTSSRALPSGTPTPATPSAELEEVRRQFLDFQRENTTTRQILRDLIADIESNRGNYSYSDDEIATLRRCSVLLLTLDRSVDSLQTISGDNFRFVLSAFGDALILTRSRAESRFERGKRRVWNVKHALHYRSEHRPLMERCQRYIAGLRRNIRARLYTTHPQATHYHIQETLRVIDAFLNACAPGHEKPGFQLKEIAPLLQIKAELTPLLLLTPLQLERLPAAIESIHNLLPQLESADTFLAAWAKGGLLQRVTTPLRKEAAPEVLYVLDCIISLQKATSENARDRSRNLSLALRNILLLNQADPTWLNLSAPSIRSIESAQGQLTAIADGTGAVPGDELVLAKDHASAVHEVLLAVAKQQSGRVKKAHESSFRVDLNPLYYVQKAWDGATYSSTSQIVVASRAITNLNKLRNNSDPNVRDEQVLRLAAEAITAINTLERWARANNQLDSGNRNRLRELVRLLDEPVRIGNARAIRASTGDLANMLLLAEKGLKAWEESGILGADSRLPAATSLTQALTTSQALIAACQVPRYPQLADLGNEAHQGIARLIEDVHLGLLPINPVQRERLEAQLNPIYQLTVSPDWSTSLIQRKEVLDRSRELNRTLQSLAIHTTRGQLDRATSSHAVIPQGPCPQEFCEFYNCLEELMQAINRPTAPQIYPRVRQSYALLSAIIETAGEDRDTLARKYTIPQTLAADLFLLQAHLRHALSEHSLGSCDPNHPHYHFFSTGRIHLAQPAARTSVVIELLAGMRLILGHWSQRPDSGGLNRVAQYLTGPRPSTPMNEEILQSYWRHIMESASAHEQQDLLRSKLEELRAQIATASPDDSSELRAARTLALTVLTKPTAPTPLEIGTALGTLEFHKAQGEVQNSPLGGLIGRHLTTATSGLPPGGVRDLAEGATRLLHNATASALRGKPPTSVLALPAPQHDASSTVSGPRLSSALALPSPSESDASTPLASTSLRTTSIQSQALGFPPELQVLIRDMEILEQAVQGDDTNAILNASRRTAALLAAILDLAQRSRGNDPASSIAELYNIPKIIADQFLRLTQDLIQVCNARNEGSCDPSSENFHFANAPESETLYMLQATRAALLVRRANAEQNAHPLLKGARKIFGEESFILSEAHRARRLEFYRRTLPLQERDRPELDAQLLQQDKNSTPMTGLIGSLLNGITSHIPAGGVKRLATDAATSVYHLAQQGRVLVLDPAPTPLALPTSSENPSSSSRSHRVSRLDSSDHLPHPAPPPPPPPGATGSSGTPPRCPPEFRALIRDMNRLEEAIQSGVPANILHATRRTAALLGATLDLAQRTVQADVAESIPALYENQISQDEVTQLIQLSQDLVRVVRTTNQGSCNPTSPRYLYADESETLTHLQTAKAFLIRQETAAASTFRAISRTAFGDSPITLPAALLQRRLELYRLLLPETERSHPNIGARLLQQDRLPLTAGGGTGRLMSAGLGRALASAGIQGGLAGRAQDLARTVHESIREGGEALLARAIDPVPEFSPLGRLATSSLPAVTPVLDGADRRRETGRSAAGAARQSGDGSGSTSFGKVLSTAYDWYSGTPDEDAAEGENAGGVMGAIQSLLRYGKDFFAQIQENGIGALPRKAIQDSAGFMFEKLSSHIDKLDPESDAEKIEQLQSVLEALETAQAEGTFDKAGDAIGKALEYIGALPSSDVPDTADPFLLDNYDKVTSSINFNTRKGHGNKPIDVMIEHEKAAFIKNTSFFAPMKFIYETYRHHESPGLEFYAEMIRAAEAAYANPEQQEEALKAAFMAQLEKRGSGGFIVKHILWPITRKISGIFLDKGLNNLIDWAKDFINKNNKDSSTDLGNSVVERTSGYLGILQSAFGRIASQDTITGTLDSEIEKALSAAAVNGGLTRQELYNQVASKVVDEFLLPPPRGKTKEKSIYDWSGNFHKWCTEPASSSAFARGFREVLTWIPCTLAYIGQNIWHFIISRVTKYYFGGDMVNTMVTQILDGMQVNGYTHAMNCTIFEQLQDVYQVLQRHYDPDSVDSEDGKPKINLKNMSIVERENLRTLVKEAFSVLPKSECGSPTDLRKVLSDKSMWTKFWDGIDDKYVYSQVTESAMELLGAAFQTVLQKGHMERQLHNFMTMANSIYKGNTPVPAAEMKAKEEGITRLLDNILNLTISKSIEESFDFDRVKEQERADQYTAEIQEITDDFLEKFEENQNRLVRLATRAGDPDSLPLDDPKVNETLATMLTLQQDALRSLVDLRERVQAAKDLPNSRDSILKMCRALNQRLKLVVRPLVALEQPRRRRAFGHTFDASVQELNTRFERLDHIFEKSIRLTAWNNGLSQIRSIGQLVVSLGEQPELNSACSQLETVLSEAEKTATLAQENSTALQILREHLKDLEGTTFRLWSEGLGRGLTREETRENVARNRELVKIIATLPCPPCTEEQKTTLTQLVRELQSTRSTETLESRKSEWVAEITGIERALLSDIKISQHTLRDVLSTSKEVLEGMAEYSTSTHPSNTFNKLQLGFEDLQVWVKEENGIHAPVLTPSAIPCKNLIARHAKNYVFRSVKQKVDGLVKFIRQPYNYRYGLFHHNLFLPFLGKN